MRCLEQWENSPAAPSGRCSDLTEVEKEKLIDLLFANNDRLMSEISGFRLEFERLGSELKKANEATARWEERTRKAESDMVLMQKKIDSLLSLVEQFQNGEKFKALLARAEKAEKMVADLTAEGKTMRGQAYGSKSQKNRKDDDHRNDDFRDAQSEKDSMGGKDSVRKLPDHAHDNLQLSIINYQLI